MTESKIIKLDKIIYSKVEYLKGKKSFGAYIGSMLKYFELTGINPESMQAPLIQETKNGTDRIVRIIKAIEKDKLNRILFLLENKSFEASKNQAFVSGITEDQLEEMVNLNQKLINDLEQMKREKIELLQQNRSLKMEVEKRSDVASDKIDIDKLLMFIGGLTDLAPEGGGRDVTINKGAILDLASRMKNCLSDVR